MCANSKIVVEAYHSEWPKIFQLEAEKIKKALNFAGNIEVHHIGSTAIPGMCAKPIIDILVIGDDLDLIDIASIHLESLGYISCGESGISRRRYFIKEVEGKRLFNLHCYESENPEIGRYLRFRDFLITHPLEARQYADLKQRLAYQFPFDMLNYLNGKTSMVSQIDRKATTIFAPRIERRTQAKLLNPNRIIQGMEDNWFLLMTHWMRYSAPFELLQDKGDVNVVVCSEACNDTFNYVLRARFSEKEAEKRVNEIKAIFQHKKLPFAWYVGPSDHPSNLSEILKEANFTLNDENFGMFLNISSFSYYPEQKIRFQRVLTKSQLKEFDEINVKSGENSHFDLIFHSLPPIIYGEGSPIELYVGYVDGVPVTSGILCLYAGVAGIYYVATIPEERRKGYAKAMMEMLFERAKECRYGIVTLQATADGKHLYEKLGFQACCLFAEYGAQTDF